MAVDRRAADDARTARAHARAVARLQRLRPRWLAAGMDRDDLARLEAAALAGESPARGLGALARTYEDLLDEAIERGHPVSAVSYGRRAALAHLMRACLASPRSAASVARARTAYAPVGALLQPPAAPVALAALGASPLAHLRLRHDEAPVALLLAEPGAAKEELGRLEERLLARGATTLSVDLADAAWGAQADADWAALARAVREIVPACGPLGVWATGPVGANVALAALRASPPARAMVAQAHPAGPGAADLAAEGRLCLLALDPPAGRGRARRQPAPEAAGGLASQPRAYDEWELDAASDWLCERLGSGAAG